MTENKSPEELQELVQQMRKWAYEELQLSKGLEDNLLRRFVHSCYYDIDKAKAAAELFFSIRSSSPDLFSNRDPQSAQMQKTLSIVNLARFQISQNRNLWIWQLNDPGLVQYDYIQDVKLFFLVTDAWLLDDEHLENSDIVIMDVKDITLKFLMKYNMSVARKLAKYQEDALPIRLKQIHLVNAPSFIDKIYGLMKPFLKQDITNMLHFHPPKADTLHKFLDKDDLPEDYGGTRGKMEDHMKNVMELLDRKREPLISENLWRVEKKSKSKSSNEQPSSADTTFRTLEID
ncbi:alpha-tocopherol transfer protein-like [Galleria mellonella]|uniref:Alpha-tocopherol transfer protein-like n=1 Tax=Galleria mellonella TaxID=7137 RepID=A0ABM3MM06_GALME|nr:alpha-tocopherol transfer protein-like [Galleria mellonella]XP_052752228.1 alpha-tocopherol transfer protein-like [Galleria mellonella]XP_052752229.1 alpha-tocopherol transfer protein-like [Galleria mellonella]